MIYLCNAFSGQMLDPEQFKENEVVFIPNLIETVPADVDFQSAVGHPDTAAVLSNVLGRTVEFNRMNVKLNAGDTVYLAQLTGGRLEPGTTTLPEGARFVFWRYDVVSKDSVVIR